MGKRPMYELKIINRIKELSEQRSQILAAMQKTIEAAELDSKVSLEVLDRTIAELRAIIVDEKGE